MLVRTYSVILVGWHGSSRLTCLFPSSSNLKHLTPSKKNITKCLEDAIRFLYAWGFWFRGYQSLNHSRGLSTFLERHSAHSPLSRLDYWSRDQLFRLNHAFYSSMPIFEAGYLALHYRRGAGAVNEMQESSQCFSRDSVFLLGSKMVRSR